MVLTGQNRFDAMGLTGADDAGVVARYDDAHAGADACAHALRDANHHRHTANVGQWLIG